MGEHVVVSRSDVVCSARQCLTARVLVYVFNLLFACLLMGESQSQSVRLRVRGHVATPLVGHLIFGG